jgi:class 3 adenylate cyclase
MLGRMGAKGLSIGAVTLLFTDIEGSTRLLHVLGEESYAEALAEHRRVLRAAFERYGGVEVDTQGDAFFFVFPDSSSGLAAAGEARAALEGGPISVRMGIHSGRRWTSRRRASRDRIFDSIDLRR